MQKVLLFTREFNRGERVSEYCRSIASFLAGQNIEPHVICFDLADKDEVVNGINVHRVSFMLHGESLFNWAMLMNNELKRRARELYESEGFDLVHANDWTTAPAAISVANLTGKPFVLTIHSTEHERGFGIKHSGIISSVEWLGAYEATRVVATNKNTYSSLLGNFRVPEKKLSLIETGAPNWESRLFELYGRLS